MELKWEDAGDGPVEDTSTRRARVTGGWLYAVVSTDPYRDRFSDESREATRILGLSFVPEPDVRVIQRNQPSETGR